ncbi:hypothetical protein EB241_09280 [Erwinia psidii]|uniref:Uncharacterized protein n=1 Tax=Erwinia psidii TaxID=69224 RepID=A0A3N6SEU1_9GAMM|nr:hypothetical protein EB241_09280 [Erwinia psidii]
MAGVGGAVLGVICLTGPLNSVSGIPKKGTPARRNLRGTREADAIGRGGDLFPATRSVQSAFAAGPIAPLTGVRWMIDFILKIIQLTFFL